MVCVYILNFRGSLDLTPFYRDSIENPQFGGEKSKLFPRTTSGESSPPLQLSVRFDPPYPGVRVHKTSKLEFSDPYTPRLMKLPGPEGLNLHTHEFEGIRVIKEGNESTASPHACSASSIMSRSIFECRLATFGVLFSCPY